MDFVKPYDEHPRIHQTHPGGPSMTKQSFAEESEINNILAKYAKTGLIQHVKEGMHYADLPSDLDYHSAMNTVMAAQQSFDDLPATVRREFENDPKKFLSFIEDPANVERMGELGLLNEPVKPPAAESELASGAEETSA